MESHVELDGKQRYRNHRIWWRADAGKALLHGHCHHKALVGNEVTVIALTAAGYDVEVIPSG